MNTNTYRKFVALLAKWPLDRSKGTRDLALHLREKIKSEFNRANPAIESEHCQRQFTALKNLADGHYSKLYFRERTNTASGLNSKECNTALSTQVLEELEKNRFLSLKEIFSNEKKD